jgi:hypothetical protein
MMAVLLLMGGDMAIPALTVAFILHAFPALCFASSSPREKVDWQNDGKTF